MIYQIIIFMTKNLLMAVDIDKKGTCEVVSINGNTELEYKETSDIDKFCLFLKEAYNIDQFSELDMSISLIKCNADEKNVNYLKDLLISVPDMNIVNAKKVLPLVLTAQGEIKKNCIINVNILNVFYQLEIDENLNIDCNEIDSNVGSKELTINMFQILCNFSAKLLISGDEELKKKDKENKEIQRKLKKEYEEQVLKLKEELEVAKTAILELQKSEELSRNKIREYTEKEKNATRTVCCFQEKSDLESNLNSLMKTICMNSILFGLENISYKIKFFITEGNIVKKNDTIASIVFLDRFNNTESLYGYIKANANGRLFHLVEDGEKLTEKGTVVAVIGNLSDTKQDIIKWYESIKE